MYQNISDKIWTKRFTYLFIINMSIFFVFYSLVTTLPLYVLDVLQQTEEEAGLLFAVFLFSAIIVRPFSGKLLDFFGKKKLLSISILFYLISTMLYLWIKPLTFLLILRFFNGIWFSIVTTATASLAADIVPDSRKGAGLGYFNMSANLAVVLGPFIGLLVIQYASYNILFYIISIVVLIGGVIALSVRTDDLPKPVLHQKRLTFSLHDLVEIKSLTMGLLGALLAFSYASVLSFMSVYAQSKGLMDVASWFYAVFAAAMLLTRPFTGKVYDQRGAQYVVIPAIFLFSLGLLCLALLSSAAVLLLAGGLIGIGYGALTTSFQSLAVQAADQMRSAYATATYFTLFDFGLAIGTYVLGIVATQVGYSNVYVIAIFVLFVTLSFYLLRLVKLRAVKTVSR